MVFMGLDPEKIRQRLDPDQWFLDRPGSEKNRQIRPDSDQWFLMGLDPENRKNQTNPEPCSKLSLTWVPNWLSLHRSLQAFISTDLEHEWDCRAAQCQSNVQGTGTGYPFVFLYHLSNNRTPDIPVSFFYIRPAGLWIQIRIHFPSWIRIRIQEGKTENKNRKNARKLLIIITESLFIFV